MTRTAQQILDQTNELARELLGIMGYEVEPGFRFDQHDHPRGNAAWVGACRAQIILTDTDVEDAISELEGDEDEVADPEFQPLHDEFGHQLLEMQRGINADVALAAYSSFARGYLTLAQLRDEDTARLKEVVAAHQKQLKAAR